uniref:Uncharacterized protein n=1 Tax=Lepeophtheirus salmonis TaxID=72036 RepID=A0A0K2VAV9_LEPSM
MKVIFQLNLLFCVID